jgi:hypothetical protein
MLLRVSHVLPKVARRLNGGGADPSCNPQIAAEALERLNDATRLLMLEGEWEGATAEICLCIHDCCFTLDEQFESITVALIDGRPADLYNESFRYLEGGNGPLSCCEGGCLSDLQDQGDGWILHKDLPRPMHIVAWSERAEGEAHITIEGLDERGGHITQSLPLRQGAKGQPPAYTAGDGSTHVGRFARITGLQKETTQGRVFVHGWEPGNHDLPWLTTLERWSLSPCHRRYLIPGGQDGHSIMARVTRRWHPVNDSSDVLLIQNIDAIELMAQALEARDRLDFGSYAALKNSALSALKKQSTRRHGHAKTALNIAPRNGPMRGRSYYNRQ